MHGWKSLLIKMLISVKLTSFLVKIVGCLGVGDAIAVSR